MIKKTILSTAVVNAICAMTVQAAAVEGANKAVLEEVLITARRYEESAQNVPVAVTAFSGEALDQKGIGGVDELILNIPSLGQDFQGAQRSTTLFTLRGVGTEDALIPMDTAVGTYFAEAPQSRPVGFSKVFYDIANIQVLKGPQGTVFGRNTTGGAILVEPNAPGNEFDANIKWQYKDHELGNGNQISAMINLPISDTVAIRLAGITEDMDGFYENVVTGQQANSEDYQAFRASIRFSPTDALGSTFIFDYYKVDDDGTAIQSFLSDGSAGNSVLFAGTYAYQTTLKDNQFQSELGSGLPGSFEPATHKLASAGTNKGVTNKTTYQLNENLLIKNVMSYRKIDTADWVDFEGQYAINPFDPVQVAFSGITSVSRVENEAYSEELQLQGVSFNGDGKWVSGLFYYNEKGTEASESVTFSNPGQFTGGVGENTSYAIFGQLDYQTPVEGLAVTAGLRYTWDDREFTVQGTNYGSSAATAIPLFLSGAAPLCRQRDYVDPSNPSLGTVRRSLSNCDITATGDESEYTYNLSVSYQIDDSRLVYATHRRGYRSFAFNPRGELPEDFEPVPSEIVNDFEVGLKADWDVGFPARTNIAAFISKFDDMQRQRVVQTASGTIGTVLFSAKKVTIQGFEMEYTLLPTDWLEITGYYSYTHGEYDEFVAPNGTDLTDHDGFMRAPENKYGITLRAGLPVDEAIGRMYAQVSYSWQDDVNYDTESNLQTDPSGSSSDLPFAVQSSFGLVNARIDWQSVMGSQFDLSLFGTNLTDERYYSDGISLSLGPSGRFTAGPLGDPRVVGLSISYNYR